VRFIGGHRSLFGDSADVRYLGATLIVGARAQVTIRMREKRSRFRRGQRRGTLLQPEKSGDALDQRSRGCSVAIPIMSSATGE
jgi:hypothetical protein